jgi:hypothetical protein
MVRNAFALGQMMGVVLDLGSEAGWGHFQKVLSCVDAC